MSQSTPIQNVTENNINDGPAINETNLSTAQQILQKYNEMEADNSDAQRQQVNGNMQNRQLDPNMQKQQRMAELEKTQLMQQQFQQHRQQMQQQQENNKNNSGVTGILNKFNDIIKNSQEKLKDVVIVVILFIALNLDVVNNILINNIPFISTDGLLNINGVIGKGVVAGVVFFIVSTLLLVL